uniref:Uncharacterized protein n=1 Tax=Ditylum brightwellii TaxID=49249 RepID=A0A7S4RD69_9STRA
MPSYFEKQKIDSGFPDNKHQEVQFTVTALETQQITVVVELLHGFYYADFDSYFGSYNKSELQIHTPSRFAYGSESRKPLKDRSMWMGIIEKQTFDSMPLELPLNLPMTIDQYGRKHFENLILVDRPSNIEVGYDSNWTRIRPSLRDIESNNSQYDDDGRGRTFPYSVQDKYESVHEEELWWEIGDQTEVFPGQTMEKFSYLAMPYLPFFSNCDGYDSHISISRLLEDNPNCTLIRYENTVPVYQYPWFNTLSPLSDTCRNLVKDEEVEIYKGIPISCFYEEEVDSPNDKLRWFEMEPRMTLFSLSKNAIPAENFEAKYNRLVGQVIERWGRSKEIEIIRSSQDMIPVSVDEVKGGIKNTIPRSVELELQYYQVNRGEKRLVSAYIYFDELCTTIKPRQMGGNAELLGLMKGRGIEPCDLDINGKLKSRDYKLRVHFHALGWFSLLNSFEFDSPIYLGFFTLVGVASAILVAIVWSINRIFTKLRYPPTFHGWSLAKLITRPQWLGCAIASFPYTLCLSVIYFWFCPNDANGALASSDPVVKPSIWAFEHLHGSWLDTAVLGDTQIEQYRAGRLGSAMLAVGLYMTVLGASLIVPEQTTKNDDKSEGDRNSEDNPIDEKQEPTPSGAWQPKVWKRAHLIWCSFCFECFLLSVWEFSYSPIFEQNIYRIIVIFKLSQMVLELLLSGILRESFNYAPFIVVMEVAEMLITIGASDFVTFTAGHFVEISIITIERMYIHPCIKVLKNLWPRWKMLAQRKFGKRKRLTRSQKQQEEMKWRRVNEDIQLRNEGVEPLLDSVALFSVEKTGTILSPIICLIVMVFFEQTQIAMQYNVRKNELGYYTLFACYMIPWTSVVDVFILNTQELIHGWRLYDYMAYQRFRFTTREYRWVLSSDTFDESISEGMQTMDLLCFSSQYYFIISVFAFAMLTNMFAITVFLRYEYNFLGDPAMPIIVLAIFLICEVIRLILCRIANVTVPYFNWHGLWAPKQLEGTMDDAIAAKLAIGEGRQADLEQERLELQALNSDRFRHRFLDRNRPWVLNHLVELITPRSLASVGPDGRPLTEFVRDVYSDLMAIGEGARKSGDRSDISSDDEGDEDFEKRRLWDRSPLTGSNLAMAKLWLSKARKRRSFGRVVSGIIQDHKEDKCSLCARTKETCASLVGGLSKGGLRDPYAIDDLITQFEQKYSINENDPNMWKAFFRSKAEYVTVCNLCIDRLEQEKLTRHIRYPGADRLTRSGDISSDDEEDEVVFDPIIVLRSSNEGKMMGKWLSAARKKIGGDFPRPESRKQMEMYAERLKRKKK